MRLAPLGRAAEINPSGPEAGSLRATQMLDFVPMASVSEDGTMTVSERRPFAEVAKGFTSFRGDDILAAKITPCFENNKIALAQIGTEYGFGSTEFHVIRCFPEVLYPRYLLHFLRQDYIRAAGERRMTGSAGQRRVPKQFFAELPVPMLPLSEQKRVAAILDQAEELRRKRQRAINRLGELAQAIFHEMFGDLATNPRGWDRVKLGEVCGVGSSKRVFVNEFVEEGIPFYRGTEIGKLGEGEELKPDLFISTDHYNDLVRHSGKPEVGDLLLPSICHDGRIWMVDTNDPFYFKDGRVLWIITGKSAVTSEYLRYHLKDLFLRNYLSIASGTTFAELKIVNLKNLEILLPPVKLQEEFASRVYTIASCREAFLRSANASASLFASLQHRAFRGELTPKDAEHELRMAS